MWNPERNAPLPQRQWAGCARTSSDAHLAFKGTLLRVIFGLIKMRKPLQDSGARKRHRRAHKPWTVLLLGAALCNLGRIPLDAAATDTLNAQAPIPKNT